MRDAYIDWCWLAFERDSDSGRKRSFSPNGPLLLLAFDHLPPMFYACLS